MSAFDKLWQCEVRALSSVAASGIRTEMMTEIFDCFDVCFFQIVNALDLACDKPLMKTLQVGIFFLSNDGIRNGVS